MWDDARVGRLYLPRDWLDQAGVEVEGQVPSAALHTVLRLLLEAAEPYYASAFAGLPALSLRCAWSIAAAARIHRVIGTRIPKGGPMAYHQRIGTSGMAKAGLALCALGDAGTSRVLASGQPATAFGLALAREAQSERRLSSAASARRRPSARPTTGAAG